jgi:hypothetical protein
MRRALLISFCAGVAVAGVLAAMVFTTGRALPAHFPRGVEACFGRVYDQVFLAAHPNHRFTELYVLREFVQGGPRGDSRESAVQAAADRASTDDLSITVVARFRDKPLAYDRGVTCTSDGPLGASCSVDCEGATFSIHPDGRGLALDHGDSVSFVKLHRRRRAAAAQDRRRRLPARPDADRAVSCGLRPRGGQQLNI